MNFPFSSLISALDQTSKTSEKIEALSRFFSQTDCTELTWGLYLLSGNKIKQPMKSSRLRELAAKEALLPMWLFEEAYATVGDLAETISLILPQPENSQTITLNEMAELVISLSKRSQQEQDQMIVDTWAILSTTNRYIFNKLLTGGFRLGVSQQTIYRSISQVFGINQSEVAWRLSGKWSPERMTLSELICSSVKNDPSKPYPFCLANALSESPESLGTVENWLVEWKWDGIRVQFIHREGSFFLWSRGEELITGNFPDLIPQKNQNLSEFALDGELLVLRNGSIGSFQDLQSRINRKKPGKKILQDLPAILICYDLPEFDGKDIRSEPLSVRRSNLEHLIQQLDNPRFMVSELLPVKTWSEVAVLRDSARMKKAEGVMLKNRFSVYETGRKTGIWFKWKTDPLQVDAVLIYAQAGHGNRANLFTDYTFGVWDGSHLVTIAKAFSGLTNAEIMEVDQFIRKNTLERFGPVRTVKPELVFEIAFESIQPSLRHKSGFAVRFPRINRWRKDKTASEADTLESVRQLVKDR